MAIVPIKLGKYPETFARTIKAQDHQGNDIQLPVVFKFRTRTQHAELLDELIKRRLPAGDGKTVTDATKLAIEANVDELMECIVNWTLDDHDFSRENLAMLCDAYPQVAAEIFRVYNDACKFGRLGN